MWATADETRADVVGLYRRAWVHADATIDALPLDTTGRVPWWPDDRAGLTLHHAVVRVIADTQRHAGHADILRELMDGAAGERAGSNSLPSSDPAWWKAYRDRLEQAARDAAGPGAGPTAPRERAPGSPFTAPAVRPCTM